MSGYIPPSYVPILNLPLKLMVQCIWIILVGEGIKSGLISLYAIEHGVDQSSFQGVGSSRWFL